MGFDEAECPKGAIDISLGESNDYKNTRRPRKKKASTQYPS